MDFLKSMVELDRVHSCGRCRILLAELTSSVENTKKIGLVLGFPVCRQQKKFCFLLLLCSQGHTWNRSRG
jgi:hypothetical protein